MDIATKLSDLRADLSECRRAITYRGGEISATAGFKEVAEKIASLPASSSIGTVVDESSSLLKIVPVDSTKYCYLKSLGGMTYRDEENNTLIDNKPTAIKVSGANCLNIDDALSYWGVGIASKDGNTYTINNIGNGYDKPYVFTDKADIYTISKTSGTQNGIAARIDIGYFDGKTFTSYGGFQTATISYTSLNKANAIRLNYGGSPTSGWTFSFTELRINLGTVDCGFTPYHKPVTYPIPEALQGTGKGVEGAADTIDFENGKKITRTKTLALGDLSGYSMNSLGGSENIYISDGGLVGLINYTINDFNHSLRLKAVCSHLPMNTDYTGKTLGVNLQPMTNTGQHYIKVSIRADDCGALVTDTYQRIVSKIIQWLKDNNVTLTYALAEPTETDIDTSAFDNLIEVEGGGSLEIITDNGGAVPTSIIYQTIV